MPERELKLLALERAAWFAAGRRALSSGWSLALTDHRIVKLAFPTGIESDGSGPLLPLGAFGVCALNSTVSR